MNNSRDVVLTYQFHGDVNLLLRQFSCLLFVHARRFVNTDLFCAACQISVVIGL